MKIIDLPEIKKAISIEAAIDAVRTGFIEHAAGSITCPTPLQMLFHEHENLVGDCHAKAAHGSSYSYAIVKVASGFYDNPKRGLPTNSGIILLLCRRTGLVTALLRDEGWLTSIRTAAAGALAANLRSYPSGSTLGVIGAGEQGRLQALTTSAYLGLSKVLIFNRSEERAAKLCNNLTSNNLDVRVASSVSELCHQCAVVITTTPATSPVIQIEDIPDSLHIVAIGSDSPGKVELDPKILAKAEFIATDDHEQCLHHGEFGYAFKAGLIDQNADCALGDLLARQAEGHRIDCQGISIVDLTGLGAQDLAVSSLIMQNLAAAESTVRSV